MQDHDRLRIAVINWVWYETPIGKETFLGDLLCSAILMEIWGSRRSTTCSNCYSECSNSDEINSSFSRHRTDTESDRLLPFCGISRRLVALDMHSNFGCQIIFKATGRVRLWWKRTFPISLRNVPGTYCPGWLRRVFTIFNGSYRS